MNSVDKLKTEHDEMEGKYDRLMFIFQNQGLLDTYSQIQKQLLVIQANALSSYIHALSLRIQDYETNN